MRLELHVDIVKLNKIWKLLCQAQDMCATAFSRWVRSCLWCADSAQADAVLLIFTLAAVHPVEMPVMLQTAFQVGCNSMTALFLIIRLI